MSTGRVWTCSRCHHQYDLAVTVPELEVLRGRKFTDAEMETLHEGKWHTCPPPEPEESRPRGLLTQYDWRTGKPR